MKRIIALALSLVTVMSLAACGSKTSGGDNSAAASGGSGDGKVYKITYANTVADSNPQASTPSICRPDERAQQRPH